MSEAIALACAAGYERLVAWSGLLDEINVFPVADADTGRNLQISLAPLRSVQATLTAEQLLRSATGNSGNIAAAFFANLVASDAPDKLPVKVTAARLAAWQAMADPQPGTMLTVFDTLETCLVADAPPFLPDATDTLLIRLQKSVASTAETLSIMRQAGVVDAGALGMYLFFEGFFHQLGNLKRELRSPLKQFTRGLQLAPEWQPAPSHDLCVDTLLRPKDDMDTTVRAISRLGRHVITIPVHDQVKVHLHTDQAAAVKQSLADLGTVESWSQGPTAPPATPADRTVPTGVHIVTDAAGSLTRDRARELGITLLDSYVIIDDHPCPETLVPPETLYAAMREGIRVSTAQASNFERHQCYQSLTERYGRVLYVSVGSVYTGNFQTAEKWKTENTSHTQFQVLDSGAASGRLALIAARLADHARQSPQATTEALSKAARTLIADCQELVFLDKLKYLVAGGRVSKARGFLADGLGLKPVIRPTAEGAQKVGVVKNRAGQLQFALTRMQQALPADTNSDILLQYTDNLDWVADAAQAALTAQYPRARIRIQPMSLTSGTHMGPGTWAVAFGNHSSA